MRYRWRYIEDDGSSASFGLAADEYITRKLPSSPYSCILRLYTYEGPYVMVGRHQDVESEVNLSYCREMGIEINRRPTGGGAIIMGKGQLGLAIASPLEEDVISPLLGSKAVFSPFTRGIIAALGLLGLMAWFRPENDIYVGDKKIAGLACCSLDGMPTGLYHASILSDMDTALMGRALKKSRGGITTVSAELGRPIGTSELRGYIKRGFEGFLHAELIPEPFSREEQEEIRKLEKRKYRSKAWIYHGEGHPEGDSDKRSEIATSAKVNSQ